MPTELSDFDTMEKFAKLLHDAGAKDSHENLSIRAKHGADITDEEYRSYRTNRHMITVLRAILAEVWDDAYEAGAADELIPNPYKDSDD